MLKPDYRPATDYRDLRFMSFWKIINDIQKSRDMPEIMYGEAKDWWREFQEEVRRG